MVNKPCATSGDDSQPGVRLTRLELMDPGCLVHRNPWGLIEVECAGKAGPGRVFCHLYVYNNPDSTVPASVEFKLSTESDFTPNYLFVPNMQILRSETEPKVLETIDIRSSGVSNAVHSELITVEFGHTDFPLLEDPKDFLREFYQRARLHTVAPIRIQVQ